MHSIKTENSREWNKLLDELLKAGFIHILIILEEIKKKATLNILESLLWAI